MATETPLAGLLPNRILAVVLSAFGILLAASIIQDVLVYSASPPMLDNKIWLLDVDVERSFYTWLSSTMLYTIGGLLILLGLRAKFEGQRFFLHWLLLGAVFILLSADEAVALHEKLSSALSQLLNTSGVLYFAWTIPALFLVGAGFIFYIPFLRSLPPAISLTMIASGVTYLTGAIGMELVAGGYVERFGVETLNYRAMANLEEALEGLGLSIFLWCVLRQLWEVPTSSVLMRPISRATRSHLEA